MKGRAFALALVALTACDDRVTPTDAGPPSDASEVTEASRPQMTPCPDGWREVPAGSGVVCEPWPEGGRPRCLSTEALRAGGCTPLAACPAGDFPEDVSGPDVRYVREGGSGDGQLTAPFGTIGQALVGAAAGTVVAVGRGTYLERVDLPSGVSLVGACPGETVIRSDEAAVTSRDSVITALGNEVRVAGLTIRSGTLAGLRVVGTATLEALVIEGTQAAGLFADLRSVVDGTHIVVRGTRRVAPLGVGVVVGPGADVTLRQLSLTENVASGLSAIGATVNLEDAVIADNGYDTSFDPLLGRGIEALDGTELTCTRCVVDDVRSRAVFVEGESVVVRLVQSLLRNPGRGTEDGEGRGLAAFEGTEVHLDRTWLDGFRQVGIRTSGAVAQLDDVVLSGTDGAALLADNEATLTAARLLVTSPATIGLALNGAGTSLDGTDLIVEDSRGAPGDGNYGIGVQVIDGARLGADRLRIARARMIALSVGGEGPSEIGVRDAVIEDTGPRACDACGDPHGDGVVATGDGTVDLTRFAVRGSVRAGLHAALGQIRAREGLVEANSIGAVVQTPGFDLMNINESVVYRDNLRRIDTSSLPVETAPVGF